MLLLGPCSSGGCRQSPRESALLLPRGCLRLSTRGKCFSRIITAASPIPITPAPDTLLQHPAPGAGLLPDLFLTDLPWC